MFARSLETIPANLERHVRQYRIENDVGIIWRHFVMATSHHKTGVWN